MSKSGAAEGPWTYDASLEVILDAQGKMIGRMEPASGPLAAAAPELLILANEILNPIMTHGELTRAARKARAKAGLE